MCGIAGIWRLGSSAEARSDQEREADLRITRAMLGAIRHRGPDDERIHASARATAGVRRLSILDIEGGAQPLSDASETIWAGNNGEFYNYREVRSRLCARGHAFRTQSDTEALPHLYQDMGAEFAREVRGMFACFVVDTRAERLVLARDRFGIKPLYYVQSGNRLWFASELRCFRLDERLRLDVDPARFRDYLALGYVPGPDTIYRGVRRLPPGHRLVADTERIRVEPYDPPGAFPVEIPPGDEARIETLERLLAASVERQLVSDVPLGVLLSGGVDSSVMTALLPPNVRSELKTFCVGFADGGHHDERAAARRVAAHLGTHHIEREIRVDAQAWFLRAASHIDEPLADPAAVPALAIADAAAREVKVLLSGTGGDELFGGYRRHRLADIRKALAVVPAPLAAGLAAALATSTGSRRTRFGEWAVLIGKALEARAGVDFLDAYVRAQATARDAAWRDVAADGIAAIGPVAAVVERMRSIEWQHDSPGPLALEFDRRFYLPDDLLAKEDRMTMACSVEGRVPYLDEEVAAFAARLPWSSKVRGSTGKWILRQIARRHLPEHVAARPKHGFSVPVTEWLRGPLAGLLRDAVASPDLSPMWNAQALRRKVDEHARGARDHGGVLWSVLVWEHWWRSASGPAAAITNLP